MRSNAVSHPAVSQTRSEPETEPGSSIAVQGRESRSEDREDRTHLLRLYTEEQVSEILQVSLSQLRKWRIKKHGKSTGPPFKKIGRLVRYPEQGLLEYINAK